VMVDSLKTLDPEWPIREATNMVRCRQMTRWARKRHRGLID
jgi:hypothetical protein